MLILKKKSILGLYLAAVIFIIGISFFAGKKILSDPHVSLLLPEQGAEWIRFREPVTLTVNIPETLVSHFRTRFNINRPDKKAILNLRAFKQAVVIFDGETIFRTPSDFNLWKKKHVIDISPLLAPGAHEIEIRVYNPNGYPALMAHCKPLDLFTGEGWEASVDGNTWSGAVSVNKKETLLPLSKKFQRTDRAFVAKLCVFLPIFLIVFACTLWLSMKGRPSWTDNMVLRASGVRWLLFSAWTVLIINNITKLPPTLGMDHDGHMEYIRYIAENMTIPLASDGWSMFNPPLYYILSGLFYTLLTSVFSIKTVYCFLHLIPFLCGALLVEACYRALKHVFPGRDDLQSIGIIVGGLIPMNLYMSHALSNESLASFLSGIAVVIATGFICSESRRSDSVFFLLGLILGLAILTKITPVVLLFVVTCFILYTGLSAGTVSKRAVLITGRRLIIVLGTVALVSGWYFIRNRIELGQFVIRSSSSIAWWQYPGYRIPEHFFTFGQALIYPVYSSIQGIWDSLYSTMWMDGGLSGEASHSHPPPWNYGFMLSSALLSLFPFTAILAGITVSLKQKAGPEKRGLLFALFCVLMYLAAVVYIYFYLPVYTTAKATYMLGLVPCFAVLCARGFNVFLSRPFFKACAWGLLASWAVCAYASFFIQQRPVETWVENGDLFYKEGMTAEAIRHFTKAIQIDPEIAEVHNNLGFILANQGRFTEAVKCFSEALRINPGDPEAHFNLGNTFAHQGRTAEAIRHFSDSLRINPEQPDTHYSLGILLTIQGRITDAVRHFSESLRIAPDHAAAHNAMGFALAEQGNTTEAVMHYQKALTINPKFADAHNGLGVILAKQNRMDEAIKHFSEALRVDPNHRDAQVNLENALKFKR